MQALRYFSRIQSLTTRFIYSEGGKKDDIAPLEPGSYHFYGKSGYLALKDNKLISAVLLPLTPIAIINVQRGMIPRTFVFQEASTKKWVKFTEDGNGLVDLAKEATHMIPVGFNKDLPTAPIPLPIPVVGVAGYGFISKTLKR